MVTAMWTLVKREEETDLLGHAAGPYAKGTVRLPCPLSFRIRHKTIPKSPPGGWGGGGGQLRNAGPACEGAECTAKQVSSFPAYRPSCVVCGLVVAASSTGLRALTRHLVALPASPEEALLAQLCRFP